MNTEKKAPVTITRTTLDGRDVIHINGVFDCIAEHVIAYTNEILLEGHREVVLDFGEVSYMTSQGIACIIRVVKLVSAVNGTICVKNANSDVADLIRMARMDSYVTME